jgi:hypothetical protein
MRAPSSLTNSATNWLLGTVRARALELFPDGAASGVLSDDAEAVSLERNDVARVSIDVQRVVLDQELKSDSQFHVVGVVALRAEYLPAVLRAFTHACDVEEDFVGEYACGVGGRDVWA